MNKTDAHIINKKLQMALIKHRKEKGLTQVEVAKRLKKPQSFVSKYETGERKLTVGDFVLVCKAMEVEIGKLLRDVASRA